LRWIHPLPKNLGGYIKSFNKVLIPEINLGQLIKIIRSEYLVDAKGFNSVRGLPLRVSDIIEAIETQLKG
jgi:2-oxoglutarate ferredoxin oxidoreductase subunit alpha